MNDIQNILDSIIKIKKNKHIFINEKEILEYILYIKYLCDANKLSYDSLNEGLSYDLIKDGLYSRYRFSTLNITEINQIIIKLRFMDIKELVEEYIDSYNEIIRVDDRNDEILCVVGDYAHELYDNIGKSTYIKDIYSVDSYIINLFMFFDEVLGIKNKYLDRNEIDFSKYKKLYISGRKKRFIDRKESVYDTIYSLMKESKDLDIVLLSKYDYVSNFKEGRLCLRYLKTVIINNNDFVIMIFNRNTSEEISIINYDIHKITSEEKLINIINNNRKQKDILVKVTQDDIRKNNMRIGFNLYQLNPTDKIFDVTKAIDENSRLINELERLNTEINIEMNKLINS